MKTYLLMETLLKEISQRALLLNDMDFDGTQERAEWIGYSPATSDQIRATEQRLGITLPDEYKTLLSVTNGFAAPTTVSPSFMPVEQIDFLRILDEDLIEIWNDVDPLPGLAESILVGGLGEEQYFLLIPPGAASDNWEYWKFASWHPGERKYDSLPEYLQDELAFLRDETQHLTQKQPRIPIDYSLRDAAFAWNWNRVFDIATNFLCTDTQVGYLGGEPTLFGMLLLASYQTHRQAELKGLLLDFQQQKLSGMTKGKLYLNNTHLQKLYLEAVTNNQPYVPSLQLDKFQQQQNPISLKQIEENLAVHSPFLNKPHNFAQKCTYIVYYLFRYGNAVEFLSFYPAHQEYCNYDAHFQAAIIYATLNEVPLAQKALRSYYQQAMEYRPLAPFLCESLLPMLDASFMKQILLL